MIRLVLTLNLLSERVRRGNLDVNPDTWDGLRECLLGRVTIFMDVVGTHL